MSDRLSPLDDRHRALGAKMVPFGGWEMPVAYPAGTIEEHLACRRDAVVFDVSHLGTVRVAGPGALAALQAAFTNDLGKVTADRAQYTHLLGPVDASVVDARVRLRVIDGRSYRQVAETLGCTEPTARARVSRGLRRIASQIKPTEQDEPIELEQRRWQRRSTT